MESKKPGGIRAYFLLMGCLLLNGIAFSPALANGEKQDHHIGRKEHYSRIDKEGKVENDGKERGREKSRGQHREGGSHYYKRDGNEKNGKERNEKETGDEFTGFVAAGLFGLANFSVIFNILSRYATRLFGSREAFKNALLAFNRLQQKHLRRYHYLMNIAAIAIASWHWYLSESASISFQQLGMVLAVFLGFSGILIKYRLAPRSLHPAILKFHASILVTLAMSFLVVGGHILIDD